MSTNWTKEQEEAISQRNKNLLVSAAAGSGKTAVLVERIVTLMLEEEVPIDALLVVTFTNAAAGEMKERIQKKLHERRKDLLQSDRVQEKKEQIDFITQQIQNIPGASISTLHAFCISILRDHFQLVGLDPAFRLVNESLGAILSITALEATMEDRYLQGEENFIQLVDSYGGSKGDKNLLDMVYSIDRFIQSQPQPEAWLDQQRMFYQGFEGLQDTEEAICHMLDLPLGQAYLQKVGGNIRAAMHLLTEAQDLAESYTPPMPAVANLAEDRAQIQGLADRLQEMEGAEDLTGSQENQILFQGLKALSSVSFSRYKSPGKVQKENYLEEDLSRVKNLRDQAKDMVKAEAANFENFFSDSLLEDMQYLSRMVGALLDLVLDYRAAYRRIKEENTVVDFSDLEHLTLKVLEEEEVQHALQDKYRYIFFDEYQDTNLVQEAIIERVKRSDNLFFVGDVKQSIYRFRLADPTIFNRRYAAYSQEAQAKKIDLSKNFRSRKEILAFCNLIFKNIMTEKYGEVDYSNEYHQLQAGRDFPAYTDNIELAIIEKSKKEYHLVEGKDVKRAGAEKILVEDAGEDVDAISLQALYVADKIQELAAQGMAYSDMAILLRSPKGKTKIFEDILGKRGIPLYVDYKASNYENLEIRSIIEYLKIVDNRKQDEALLAAMASIFGNFDHEELLQIRAAYPDFEFHKAVESYERDLSDDLSLKIEGFYQALEEDIRMEKMLGLGDFIWQIAEKRGLNTYISALENGEQRLYNIKNLADKAREYEETEPRGLFGFLRQLDAMLKEKVEDATASTLIESENVVSLMSIHKSKGLEFPVLFLCNLEKRINEMDLRQNIILHNDLGLGLRYINADLGIRDDNMVLSMIRDQKQAEGISEEIRILYVAMTRAIDRLYLVGTVPNIEKFAEKIAKGSLSSNIPKQKTFLEWIGNVVIREQKGQELRDYADASLELNETEACYHIRLLREEDLLGQELAFEEKEAVDLRNIIKNRADRRERKASARERALGYQEGEDTPEEAGARFPTRDLFDRYQQFEYAHLAQTKKRVKIGVTELVKGYKTKELEEKEELGNLKRPLFSKRSQHFKPHEIGTIVHFLMEHIPLTSYSLEALEAEIQTMVDKELLTEEEARVLPRERILSFFASDLGRRMLASQRVQRERNFLMKQEDYLVEGIIDCYFEEADGIVLLDYKTDWQINPAAHQDQLAMYRRAIEAMEGKPVKESYIYWISHDSFTAVSS